MKIAYVGCTFSEFDIVISQDVYKILKLEKDNILDLIDLSKGRDFLKENNKYDIVVLFYIFLCTKEELLSEGQYWNENDESIKVSELHSPLNWRNRLLDSEAKEILIFGFSDKSEVAGKYIGELKNYISSTIEFKTKNGLICGRLWRYTHD